MTCSQEATTRYFQSLQSCSGKRSRAPVRGSKIRGLVLVLFTVIVLVLNPERGPKAEQKKQMAKNKRQEDKKNRHTVSEEQLGLMEPVIPPQDS